jgi:hypothetical protein
MTKEQMWETFRVLDSVEKIRHVANIAAGRVELEIADPKHGNFVVRNLTAVPTQEDAKRIIAEMHAEIVTRAKASKARNAAARNSYEG